MLKVTQPVSSRAWLDFSMSFPSTLGKNQLNFSSKEIKLERGKRKKESPWHTSFLLLALPLVANETVLPSRKTKPRKQRFFFFFFFCKSLLKVLAGGRGCLWEGKGSRRACLSTLSSPVDRLFPSAVLCDCPWHWLGADTPGLQYRLSHWGAMRP